MKYTVDAWDPAYGSSDTGELEISAADLQLELERPMAAWAPIGAAEAGASARPDVVWFCDGVRRVEARVWIEEGDAVHAGLCASYAAGLVRCDRRSAEVVALRVRRGLFTPAPSAESINTSCGRFEVRMTASGAPDRLSLELQHQMTRTEVEMADEVIGAAGELLVVDGPLRGRGHLRHAIGLVKTHHTEYLPPELLGVLRALTAGERTPVFTIGGEWTRHSWYLRLPGPGGGPRAGIVRCEAPSELTRDEVVALADTSASVLSAYASEPHKDQRAPQNLYPIAGLERELRHRLGDPALVLRSLRVSAGATRSG
jgi:hypothetical protein